MFVLVVNLLQKLNVSLEVLERPLYLPGVDIIEVPVVLVYLPVEEVYQILQGVPYVLDILGHANLVVKVHDLGVVEHLEDLQYLVVVVLEQLDFLEPVGLEGDLVLLVEEGVVGDEFFEL